MRVLLIWRNAVVSMREACHLDFGNEKSLKGSMLTGPLGTAGLRQRRSACSVSPPPSAVLSTSLLLSLHRRKHFLRRLFTFTPIYCFCGALNGRNIFEHLCVRHDSILKNIISSWDSLPCENWTTTCNFCFLLVWTTFNRLLILLPLLGGFQAHDLK